jgi:hypothetical protein
MRNCNVSILGVLLLALVALPVAAAEVVVTDFNDGTAQGWTGEGVRSPGLVIDAPGPSALPTDRFLSVTDTASVGGIPGLRLFAAPAFLGDLSGIARTCGALELDFRVLDDQFGDLAFRIEMHRDPDGFGQGAPPEVAAVFRLARTLDESDGWVHIVVPLALLADGALPSNADGAWEMAAGHSPSQWNALLSQVDVISFPLEINSGTFERHGIDNVRLVTGGCSLVGACSEIQVLPFYLADTSDESGVNTLFAVRNLTEQEVVANIDYFALSGEKQLGTSHPLGPRETITVGIRDVPIPVDPDGFRRGFVRVVAPGRADGVQVLGGDFFQVDTLNNFATGDELLRRDCSEASIRFLDFGSGTRLLVYLTQPRGDAVEVDPPSFTVLAYDEAGQALGPAVPFWSADNALEIAASDITPELFGTLRFDFANALGGAVYAEYSAEGRFSVGTAGECEDAPSCGPDCCPPGAPTALTPPLHYPSIDDCTQAGSDALRVLESFHYRNACQKANGGELPDSVLGARLLTCEVAPPGFSEGAVVTVEVCCPEP